MLLRWKNTTASTSLYQDLYNALCHDQVGLNKLAKEFCCKKTTWRIFFFTERLLKVEGAPENIDLQGVRQKNPGHWLIEKDEPRKRYMQLIKRSYNTIAMRKLTKYCWHGRKLKAQGQLCLGMPCFIINWVNRQDLVEKLYDLQVHRIQIISHLFRFLENCIIR